MNLGPYLRHGALAIAALFALAIASRPATAMSPIPSKSLVARSTHHARPVHVARTPRVTTARTNMLAAGMVIGIDRESRALVMPVRPGARMPVIDRSSRPAPIHRPDGSMSLDVRGWMREHAVVRLGADGKPAYGCVEAPVQLQDLHDAPAPTPAAEER